MTTIEIKGMDELNKIFRELPHQITSRLVHTALTKAAKPMKDEAVSNAPRRTGRTKKAITIVKNKWEDMPSIMIAPTKGKRMQHDAWYARFQELGTSGFGRRRRSLKSMDVSMSALRKGKLTRKYQTTGYRFRGTGLPAKEFMLKAFLAKQSQVMGSVNKELSSVVTKYLRKNAPRYYVG